MMEKKRYVRIGFAHSRPLSGEEAKTAVYEAVFGLIGEGGAAKARITWKDFDEPSQKGVLKCSTLMLEKVVAALALKRYWQGGDVALRVEAVSGMIGKVWDKPRPPKPLKST